MSPHAGSIYWAQLFFDNLKAPILKFQAVDELKGAPLKIEAFENYVKVGKMLRQYQQAQYDGWKKEALQVVSKTLSMNIVKVSSMSFKKDELTSKTSVNTLSQQLTGSSLQMTSSLATQQSMQAAKKGLKLSNVGTTVKWLVAPKPAHIFMEKIKNKMNVTWLDLMGNDMMSEHNVYFDLNFNQNILNIYASAKFLEQFGYEIIEEVKLHAIKREVLRADVSAVQDMLRQYNDIVQNLTTPQVNKVLSHFLLTN